MEKSKTLGIPQAMARFAIVSLAEILALLACYVPLIDAREPWQKDCLKLGITASLFAFLAIGAVTIAFGIFPKPKGKPPDLLARQINLLLEGGILGIYLINMIILVPVIIRTGGPSASLYAPLIPIQLSGILFLQIQKELLVREPPIIPMICTFVACGAMALTYLSPNFIWSLARLTRGSASFDFRGWNTALTIAGMFLAFLTYLIPKQEWLTDKFELLYPRD